MKQHHDPYSPRTERLDRVPGRLDPRPVPGEVSDAAVERSRLALGYTPSKPVYQRDSSPRLVELVSLGPAGHRPGSYADWVQERAAAGVTYQRSRDKQMASDQPVRRAPSERADDEMYQAVKKCWPSLVAAGLTLPDEGPAEYLRRTMT
jgi:hypothetical protein